MAQVNSEEMRVRPGDDSVSSNGMRTLDSKDATGDDIRDEDRPHRGVHALWMPRRVIAEVTGTVRLDTLLRHKPEIVPYPVRQFREGDDE